MPTALRREAFERLRLAARQHLLVVVDEPPRRFFRVELEVALADDLGGGPAEEACGGAVDEDVAAIEILDEDGVRRRFDDRLQDVDCSG